MKKCKIFPNCKSDNDAACEFGDGIRITPTHIKDTRNNYCDKTIQQIQDSFKQKTPKRGGRTIKILKELPKEFDMAVCRNTIMYTSGQLIILAKGSHTVMLEMGHHLSQNSTVIRIDSDIVDLIKMAVVNEDMWVVALGDQLHTKGAK